MLRSASGTDHGNGAAMPSSEGRQGRAAVGLIVLPPYRQLLAPLRFCGNLRIRHAQVWRQPNFSPPAKANHPTGSESLASPKGVAEESRRLRLRLRTGVTSRGFRTEQDGLALFRPQRRRKLYAGAEMVPFSPGLLFAPLLLLCASPFRYAGRTSVGSGRA
jgi:hypothetical protein